MAEEGRDQHQEAFLYSGRIVPIKREGNIVYARTLRRGEEDTGEVVDLQPGDRLVIPKGEFQVDSRDIDEHFNPKGLGGYRPVANTVWSWYRIATEQLGFFLFFFALARRTDAAHSLWVLAIEARDKARQVDGIPARLAHFNALGAAEVAIVALGRCYLMVKALIENYCPELQLPGSVVRTWDAVLEMRNSFEHIDERAVGNVGRGKLDADALTIFNQPEFVRASILQYKEYTLDFESDVITALVDCRELIMNAIDARAKQQTQNKSGSC